MLKLSLFVRLEATPPVNRANGRAGRQAPQVHIAARFALTPGEVVRSGIATRRERAPLHERITVEHPAGHRQHVAVGAATHRTGERFAHTAESGEREPDRQHEGPDGACDDRSGGVGRTSHHRRRGGRVHRRQHGRLTIARVRSEGLSTRYRHVGCLLPREARSYENSWGTAAPHSQRQRSHDGKAHPRHDRGGPTDSRTVPGAFGPIR